MYIETSAHAKVLVRCRYRRSRRISGRPTAYGGNERQYDLKWQQAMHYISSPFIVGSARALSGHLPSSGLDTARQCRRRRPRPPPTILVPSSLFPAEPLCFSMICHATRLAHPPYEIATELPIRHALRSSKKASMPTRSCLMRTRRRLGSFLQQVSMPKMRM